MADNDFSLDLFDELDQEIDFDSLMTSKRIAVRYQRDDIRATLKMRKLFAGAAFPARLLDISSKGAAVYCERALTKNAKVKLELNFKDERVFEIDAIVVRTESAPEYGLRFERSNSALAEHLLDTQTDLRLG